MEKGATSDKPTEHKPVNDKTRVGDQVEKPSHLNLLNVAGSPENALSQIGKTPGCDTTPQLGNQKLNNTCGLPDLSLMDAKVRPNVGAVEGKGTGDIGPGEGSAAKVCMPGKNGSDKDCVWTSAAHVFDGDKKQLRTADNQVHDIYDLHTNQLNDKAWFKTKGDEHPTAERPGLEPADKTPQPGDPALGYGYGAGLRSPMLSPGQVNDPARYHRNEPIQGEKVNMDCLGTNSHYVPGQSGGALLDKDGKWTGAIAHVGPNDENTHMKSCAVPGPDLLKSINQPPPAHRRRR
jgi:hypothetical protein